MASRSKVIQASELAALRNRKIRGMVARNGSCCGDRSSLEREYAVLAFSEMYALTANSHLFGITANFQAREATQR